MLLRLRGWLPFSLGLSILLAAALAQAHPFVDMSPAPPATVASGTVYNLVLVIFPGDTAVTQLQLDFELSSPLAFGVLPPQMADGFTFVRDAEADPLHFSIEGDFHDAPLEEFGAFPIGTVSLVAAKPDDELLLAESGFIEAVELGQTEIFEVSSAVGPDGVVARVVPEPAAVPSLAASLALLAAVGRRRARR